MNISLMVFGEKQTDKHVIYEGLQSLYVGEGEQSRHDNQGVFKWLTILTTSGV
jgi:hypothetical protein